MKKAILILSIIFISISVKSQVYQTWSDPIALTDSSSSNSNPDVVSYDGGESYMFYEKSSTIWWKKISEPMSDEQMLISGWPEVNYRNPKVVNYNFLIFECNATNNDQYEIFGVKFDENGLVGNSFQLTNTNYDENSFYATNSSSICCWESEGNIIVADIQNSGDTLQFTNLEIIDSGNCFDPVCKNGFISWRKIEANESHIYYSEKPWTIPEWSDPEIITQTGNNTNLSLSRTLNWFEGGYHLCWQSPNLIYFCEVPSINIQISSPDIPGIDNYFEPTAFNLVIAVDYTPELYSFAGETNSIRNIYIKDDMYSGEVVNITDDTLVNKNPQMFAGSEYSYHYDVYNSWQTEIDGYDVLFMSMASYLFGEINENNAIHFEISPNPASNNQNITISTAENIKVYSAQIYSVSGELILKTDFDPNSNNYEIDLGEALPGVYFIKFQTLEGEVVRKVIKR